MAADSDMLLRYIRRLAGRPEQDGASDAALLGRFISARDEEAFAALVDRHGPLVLHVCRRVLGNVDDAEDAFQAAFMVLARKAGTVHGQALAAWLHGVAYRVAIKSRSAQVRQFRAVQPLAEDAADPQLDPLAQLSARELLAIVDEEVRRLPQVYRLPVILCCLEGRSQEEAARHLGWTPGSVKGRLERGRARLHSRLVRRGLTLSAALAAAEVSRGAVSAATVGGLVARTVRGAVAFGAGQTAATTGVSVEAVALAGQVIKAMALAKCKLAAVLMLTLAMLTAAVGVGAQRGLFAQAGNDQPVKPAKPLAQSPDRPRDERATHVRVDLYDDPLPDGAIARLGTMRFRQGTYVGQSQLAFTPEGSIWTAESCEQVLHINNKRSLTGEKYTWNSEGPEPVLHLWDRASGKELRRTRRPKGTQVYFLTSQAGRIVGSWLSPPMAERWPPGARPMHLFCGTWPVERGSTTSRARFYRLGPWRLAWAARL